MTTPTITHYDNRPGVFAIQMPDGRWQDYDLPTLAAEFVHYREQARRFGEATEQLKLSEFQEALSSWEAEGDFTEALDASAARLLMELGTAGMSVLPTGYILQLQADATAGAQLRTCVDGVLADFQQRFSEAPTQPDAA